MIDINHRDTITVQIQLIANPAFQRSAQGQQ